MTSDNKPPEGTPIHLIVDKDHPYTECGLTPGDGVWWSGVLSDTTCEKCLDKFRDSDDPETQKIVEMRTELVKKIDEKFPEKLLDSARNKVNFSILANDDIKFIEFKSKKDEWYFAEIDKVNKYMNLESIPDDIQDAYSHGVMGWLSVISSRLIKAQDRSEDLSTPAWISQSHLTFLLSYMNINHDDFWKWFKANKKFMKIRCELGFIAKDDEQIPNICNLDVVPANDLTEYIQNKPKEPEPIPGLNYYYPQCDYRTRNLKLCDCDGNHYRDCVGNLVNDCCPQGWKKIKKT